MSGSSRLRRSCCVSLNEYADIDLAYATTYDKAEHMELHQVFVLADSRAPTRQFVESLPAFHVQVYADAVTASKCFPEHADGHYRCPSADLTADPLGSYRAARVKPQAVSAYGTTTSWTQQSSDVTGR